MRYSITIPAVYRARQPRADRKAQFSTNNQANGIFSTSGSRIVLHPFFNFYAQQMCWKKIHLKHTKHVSSEHVSCSAIRVLIAICIVMKTTLLSF